MSENYKIPLETRVGHVHLKVSDIERSLFFYHDILGFDLVSRFGSQAAFLSAGGYHHHIGLNTWESKGATKAPRFGVGLYHVAFVYPNRKDLASILKRLIDFKIELIGASDHGVSEAIYLEDPDGNGIELYWDKPKNEWPLNPDGTLLMYTKSLDLNELLQELNN